LQTVLFEPFEILRHSNQASYRKEVERAGSRPDLEIWLPEYRGALCLREPVSYIKVVLALK
jgi:hypothetical protein